MTFPAQEWQARFANRIAVLQERDGISIQLARDGVESNVLPGNLSRAFESDLQPV